MFVFTGGRRNFGRTVFAFFSATVFASIRFVYCAYTALH
jgi:hypothetical protein